MHKISESTIIRTIVLLVMMLNQVLALFGHSPLPFSDDQINEGVSTVLTILASFWSWWKNNNFTKESILAQHHLNSLKKDKSTKAKPNS